MRAPAFFAVPPPRLLIYRCFGAAFVGKGLSVAAVRQQHHAIGKRRVQFRKCENRAVAIGAGDDDVFSELGTTHLFACRDAGAREQFSHGNSRVLSLLIVGRRIDRLVRQAGDFRSRQHLRARDQSTDAQRALLCR